MSKVKIGREEVLAARQTLQRYKQGKANLEQRIVENEQWYRLRHWECMRGGAASQVEPVSGWLFNAISNKHADAMDNIPAPNILPREAGDRDEAAALSAVVPVILEQNDFETVYHKLWDHKLRFGTGVYGVFWDKEKLGGLGDISIQRVDVLNLFWESGVTDIQDSRNLFHVALLDDDLLVERYPELQGKTGEQGELKRYLYDDTVDCTGKTAVVDWYYKKNGKLHFCKFSGDQVLFSTENAGMDSWYDHGLYPFVFDPLFSVEGTPCGFGYIDVGKSAQEYIDRGNQAVLQNLLANARPRHFIRSDGSVNEAEYADLTRDFVHVDGALGHDSIQPITGTPLPGVYVEVIQSKIDELKEVTGNRDISTGGIVFGVTAASAIAAMQEAGSKLSRDHNKASYRAYRNMVQMVIELIRQFYSLPRVFRITGGQEATFQSYSNLGLLPRQQEAVFGVTPGLRLPVFDVEVTVQRKSPYSRMSQNELALQFYNAGFFDPGNAAQALACLEMMDFDGKSMVMGRLRERMQAVTRPFEEDTASALPPAPEGKAAAPRKTLALKGEKGESHVTRNARQRVAESTAPT